MKFRKAAISLSSLVFIFSNLTSLHAAAPVQFSNISVYSKFDTFIILNVTGRNSTSRSVKLTGYFYAKTSDGSIYGAPDFETLTFYDVYPEPCGGDSVDGYWKPKQVARATWCFEVPKGKTITSVFISSSKYSSPLTSTSVKIKN